MSNFIRAEIDTIEELESLIPIFPEDDLKELAHKAQDAEGGFSLIITVEVS